MTGKPCDRCGQALLWAKTENLRPMPLDPEPTEDGNVAAHHDHNFNWRARVLRKGEQPESYEQRYMPHFATCQRQPQAAATPEDPPRPRLTGEQLATARIFITAQGTPELAAYGRQTADELRAQLPGLADEEIACVVMQIMSGVSREALRRESEDLSDVAYQLAAAAADLAHLDIPQADDPDPATGTGQPD